MSTPARLGEALRNIRLDRNLTLKDVARKTGLSSSTLSKVERNQLSLTYDKLIQLANGLEEDITTFFAGSRTQRSHNAPGRRSVTRHDECQVIETDNYIHLYPNTDLLARPFVPIIAELKARSLEEFGPLISHDGEEYVYVLQGTVLVYTEFYAPYRLEVGDSMHIDSNMGHAYIAGTSDTCKLMSICSVSQQELLETARGLSVGAG
jgi:transcriptional regulator with XRE-family HTH domain